MAKYMDEPHESDRKQFSATEARQGFLGKPVLKVLGISLGLVLLAWAGAALWGESTDTDSSTETQQSNPATTGGAETSGQDTFDNNAPATETQQTVPTDTDPTVQSGTGGESQQTTPDGTEP